MWVPLAQYVSTESIPPLPIISVPTQAQLEALNETSIPNIRYYYTTILLTNGQSTGITDSENDFRHFGFRLKGGNSYMQAQSIYTIGAAVGVWAVDGGFISLTNATTNLSIHVAQGKETHSK